MYELYRKEGALMENKLAKQMEMVLYRTQNEDICVNAIIKDETI